MKKLDKCQMCRGQRGGVPGNENHAHGLIVCDFCHADLIRVERAVRAETLAAAAKIARLTKGGFTANIRTSPKEQEMIRDPDGPWVLNAEIAERIESVQFTPDGRWQSLAAMKLWGEATNTDGEALHKLYDGNGRERYAGS